MAEAHKEDEEVDGVKTNSEGVDGKVGYHTTKIMEEKEVAMEHLNDQESGEGRS